MEPLARPNPSLLWCIAFVTVSGAYNAARFKGTIDEALEEANQREDEQTEEVLSITIVRASPGQKKLRGGGCN